MTTEEIALFVNGLFSGIAVISLLLCLAAVIVCAMEGNEERLGALRLGEQAMLQASREQQSDLSPRFTGTPFHDLQRLVTKRGEPKEPESNNVFDYIQ